MTPGNALTAQHTTLLRITKEAWQKMATPIAKVARQRMLPPTLVAVRPRITLPIAMVA